MTSTLNVLIVDDSESDAALVVHALVAAGYDVRHERVWTDEMLTAALRSGPWDIVVSDYVLQRCTGVAALQEVRRHDIDLPFVFVSGTAGEEAAVDAMKAGAHDYIRKGPLKRFVAAVRREVRAAAARRERRRIAQRVAHLAYHDALTDLPNRTLLRDRLAQAIRAAHRDRLPLALLVLDLDGFKAVNDTLGHRAGDRVLRHVAACIRGVLREVDTVARLGGDEFAIVLPSTALDGAMLAAQKVLAAVAEPVPVEHHRVAVRGSIGIAWFPDHAKSADALLQKADLAMYAAKADQAGISIHPARRPGKRRSG